MLTRIHSRLSLSDSDGYEFTIEFGSDPLGSTDVSVYKQKEFRQTEMSVKVNWCAKGSVDLEEADRFTQNLIEANKLADRIRNGEITDEELLKLQAEAEQRRAEAIQRRTKEAK